MLPFSSTRMKTRKPFPEEAGSEDRCRNSRLERVTVKLRDSVQIPSRRSQAVEKTLGQRTSSSATENLQLTTDAFMTRVRMFVRDTENRRGNALLEQECAFENSE